MYRWSSSFSFSSFSSSFSSSSSFSFSSSFSYFRGSPRRSFPLHLHLRLHLRSLVRVSYRIPPTMREKRIAFRQSFAKNCTLRIRYVLLWILGIRPSFLPFFFFFLISSFAYLLPLNFYFPDSLCLLRRSLSPSLPLSTPPPFFSRLFPSRRLLLSRCSSSQLPTGSECSESSGEEDHRSKRRIHAFHPSSRKEVVRLKTVQSVNDQR